MRRLNAVSAIKSLALILLIAMGNAHGAPVGQVTNLSGPLFALNIEGVQRILSVGSQVEPGETLITEEKTYAQVRFIDKGVVTLRPGTQFKIESFAFDEKAPEKDNAMFGLLKGALRTVTGMIGKRGNQDAYKMNTSTATIGIRGTGFGATLCPGPGCGNLAPGTYVDVFEGQVAVTPPSLPAVPGITLPPPPPPLVLSAGQFGHAPPPSVGPPQQLPADPGVGRTFTPPPTFRTTEQQAQQAPAGQPISTPSSNSQQRQNQQGEGCEVR